MEQNLQGWKEPPLESEEAYTESVMDGFDVANHIAETYLTVRDCKMAKKFIREAKERSINDKRDT